MYLKFNKGVQKEVITNAIKKAGSERKLCKIAGISKGTIYKYKFEYTNISKTSFQRILHFLNEDFNNYRKYIVKELPDNWGRVKGGINCVAKKKAAGKFDETIEKLRRATSKRMIKWHKDFKANHPKKYHLLQYDRFKKIDGGYKYKLKNGTPIRNHLEKELGDFLSSQKIKFDYEPYVNIDGKVYFPDFKIKNKIIEATEWKHPDKKKLHKLKTKLTNYKKERLETVLFVPKNLRKFYKEVGCEVLSTLNEIRAFLVPR